MNNNQNNFNNNSQLNHQNSLPRNNLNNFINPNSQTLNVIPTINENENLSYNSTKNNINNFNSIQSVPLPEDDTPTINPQLNILQKEITNSNENKFQQQPQLNVIPNMNQETNSSVGLSQEQNSFNINQPLNNIQQLHPMQSTFNQDISLNINNNISTSQINDLNNYSTQNIQLNELDSNVNSNDQIMNSNNYFNNTPLPQQPTNVNNTAINIVDSINLSNNLSSDVSHNVEINHDRIQVEDNNRFINNNFDTTVTTLNDLNIENEDQNIPKVDYLKDPKVQKNIENNAKLKKTITITQEMKVFIIIIIVLLVFIFIMPYIFDAVRDIKY